MTAKTSKVPELKDAVDLEPAEVDAALNSKRLCDKVRQRPAFKKMHMCRKLCFEAKSMHVHMCRKLSMLCTGLQRAARGG